MPRGGERIKMSELHLGLFDTPDFSNLLEAPRRPRKNRTKPIWNSESIAGSKEHSIGATSSLSRFNMLKQVAKRHPEVVIKITGTNKEAGALRAHLSYLQRRAEGQIVDEHGIGLLPHKDTVASIMQSWGLAVAEGRENEESLATENTASGDRRYAKTIALHIVLSMPRNTNAEAVMQAARGFADEELQNHQHVLVLHVDKAHPHVHVVVNNIGNDLRRLPRRREDLQRWREVFARELRAQGIEAAATPRKARGVLQKGENSSVWHAEQRMFQDRAAGRRTAKPLRVLQQRVEQAENERRGVWDRSTSPAETRARSNRQKFDLAIGDAIKTLYTQGTQGRQVADDIAKFAQQVPPAHTVMDEVRRNLRQVVERRSIVEQAETRELLPERSFPAPGRSR